MRRAAVVIASGPVRALMLVVVVAGCGRRAAEPAAAGPGAAVRAGTEGGTGAEAGTGTAAGAGAGTGAGAGAGAGTAATRPRVDDLVATWGELAPRLHGLHRGRLEVADGAVCVSGMRTIAGAGAGGAPPPRLCTPLAEVVGWHGGDVVPLVSSADAWIATAAGPGSLRVVAAVGAWSTARDDDRDARDALARQYHCGQLGWFWGQLPAADLACRADADCRLLTATCFTAAVAVAAAAPYEAVRARWGGTCLHPAGGMCPPARAHAACLAGRCAVVHD